jgi:polyisoprenyl-phosphate glycosyltransferase
MLQSRSEHSSPVDRAEEQALDVSVCIPVYNERLALRQSLLALMAAMANLPYSYEIIVIDDASTDGCLDTIRDLPVRLVRHKRNLGGGIARLTGLRYARGRLILQSDADGTYPCDRIGDMLQGLESADMVIGARKSESATDRRLLRIMMKGLLKRLASVLAGYSIPDLNSGMRAYHRDAALRYAYLYPRGHSIMSTMTLAFVTDGLKVRFIEIDYHVRLGKSSFRPLRDTYNYFFTILRTIIYFDPLRILMPAVLASGVFSLLFTLRNLYLFSSLGAVPVLLWTVTLLLFVVALQSDQFSKISRQLAFLDPIPPYHRDVIEEAVFPVRESKVESTDVSGAGR